MRKPFELPEGMEWRELDDRDRSWWCGDGQGSFPMGLGVPLDACASMSIRFTLRRKSDGAERVVVDRWIPFEIAATDRDDLLTGIAFQYMEGNMGCGCNRSMLFDEAGGDEHDEDTECNDDFEIVAPRWLADIDAGRADRYDRPAPWAA